MLATALALSRAPAGAHDEPANPTVATIGTRTVTQAELQNRVRGRLIELDAERYEALREGLDELIDDILVQEEAQTRQMTVEELFKVEVEDKVRALNESQPIDAGAIEQFYKQYGDQLGNQPLETMRPSIQNYLEQQRVNSTRATFVASLRQKANVAVLLRPPRVDVSAEGPSRGPAEAPVTIVEFSDFECPFCQRAAGTIEQVMKEYKDRVRLVYRHYPLPNHANAKRAAEAATCAHEGGKFWPYHDLLFGHQNALGLDDLNRYAREVELDPAAFSACLESGRATTVVDKDVTDADAAGVDGTPAFFINGRPLSGAQPYEAFREAIDEELAERRSSRGAVEEPSAGSSTGK